ncbi:hypothetical protein PG995_007437 [Apiospora arundinis]
MRFINTTTFQFQELWDSEIRDLENGYSILSHRWTRASDEITYHDVLEMDAKVRSKRGYPKFAGACAVANALGYELIWIDTCCINKTDPVELSEAINSMCRWYAESDACIAFLEDVTSPENFNESDWFTRGWTLQELIAPKAVRFYDANWGFLGDKQSLQSVIVDITGIPVEVLTNAKSPQTYSIAQRMSWAARRMKERVEDRAYSLMGLFDVHMSIIYGEREKAFLRLQQHIIAQSADETIFAWDFDILDKSGKGIITADHQVFCGILAPSPACFARGGNLLSRGRSRGFRMDQFGLHLEVTAAPAAGPLGTYKAILNVRTAKSSEQYCIFLIRSGENEFVRSSSHAGESFVWTNYVWAKDVPQKVMDFNVPVAVTEPPVYIYPGFCCVTSRSAPQHIMSTYMPNDDRIKLPDDGEGTVGIIQLSRRTGQPGYAWIKLGFGPSLQPMCCVVLPASVDPKAYRYQAEGYKQMQIQAGNLLQCAPDSYLRWEHTIFDNGWTKANERALSGFPWVSESSYEAHMGIGGLDKGFEFTYKGPGFDISISAKRVPDMEHGGYDGVPGEVWALDISCNDVLSAQLEEDKEEKDSSCWFCSNIV